MDESQEQCRSCLVRIHFTNSFGIWGVHEHCLAQNWLKANPAMLRDEQPQALKMYETCAPERQHKARLSLPCRPRGENCAPPVNCEHRVGIQKALEEVQSALKASDQLRRKSEVLTSREDARRPDVDKASLLRQPKAFARGPRRASTGLLAKGMSSISTLRNPARPDALAQARSLHKELVQAEERSRQFSLSITDRLRQMAG